MDTLNSFLDRKFAKNKRVPLKALTEPIRSGHTIPAGVLVVMASGDRQLRIKILEKDTPHKGFSAPLPLNEFAAQHKITPHYLFWFLSQQPVAEYLVARANGLVFLRVPKSTLMDLPIPLPTRVTRIRPAKEFSVVKLNNPFSRLIGELHNDYLLNTRNHRYRTAAILAGAICEVILYQMLIEQGVSPSHLENDRSLGLNKLLDYVRVLQLDQQTGFPISQLVELQRNRNEAVHAGRLVNSEREISAKDLEGFNLVVKYFGI
ncbi:hypothetical protein C7S18_15880 [Ahniella affigens]|uniref:DUF4145 domain-containing protein n=1 Tax=Ahniella affigens TaxID=2021234 RepID=A0A2P1PUP8_9GAMM|nr:hypothetical protein [Ahniella affigens]AVP98575.1 hypothetical protein C7S18_15880 [Ahniella affigens]